MKTHLRTQYPIGTRTCAFAKRDDAHLRVCGAAGAGVVAALAFVLAFMFPQGAWAAQYDVGTIAQWNALVAKVNAGTKDYAGDTVRITADLNFNGVAITPLGTTAHPFKGILNGGGHTFSQFRINVSGSVQGVGLVGVTQGPITGVNIGGLSVINISEGAGGRVVRNVGMVVGYTTSSVTNCNNRFGSISITSAVSQTAEVNFLVTNVGGVAGQVLGDVSGCSNGGTISVKQTSTPRTANEQSILAANIGGVVGCLGTVDSSLTAAPGVTEWIVPAAGAYDRTHGSLGKCSNSGSIAVSTTSEAGLDRFGQTAYAQSTNIGGIAGYSRGSVSGCTNTGFLNAPRGTGVGGIVGGLRALTTSSSYSGNFSSKGSDDGMATTEKITVSGCTSSADIVGFVFPGGIVGRAGTYTVITDCLSGLTTAGANANMYIVAERWNKPFPAGIVGSTYGTVSYCANFASVASGYNFDHSAKTLVTRSGYYASGLVGNTSRFTDSNLNPTSPLPEVYGSYNVGTVLAVANMRQRALVGDNGGFVHDNVALEGCVSTNNLLYGDDPDESESSGGSASNNMFATVAQMKGSEFIDANARSTVISVMNTNAEPDGWVAYWARSNSNSVNQGYPVLNRQVSWNRDDLSQATVSRKADAEYTGKEAVPQASVSLNGRTLVQNVDYRVIPQSGAVEVSSSSNAYTASIQGIGGYAGSKSNAFKYGIGKGNLANCTVVIDSQQYNARAQTINSSGLHIYNLAGDPISLDEVDAKLTPGDKNLTNGKAINAKKYGVTITAKASSKHFYGTNTSGVFNISTAKIICSNDSSVGNRAEPDGIIYLNENIPWYSNTLHPSASDNDLIAAHAVFQYTGHPIKPKVSGVTFSGTTVQGKIKLTEGVDYRVVYGATSVDGATTTVDNTGSKGKKTYGYVMVRYVQGGNFSNYEIMKFIIDGTVDKKLDISKGEIVCPKEIIYEPEAGVYEPVEVWFGGSQLTRGTDYTISYSNNSSIGKASYTVTGKGLYEGTLSGSFNIVKGEPVVFTYDYGANGTATVTGVTYKGTLDAYKLSIPSTTTKDGRTYTVTAIGDYAFGSNNYTELTDSQRKIGSVIIPSSVQSIGAWAFCTANAIAFETSNITSVTFEKGSQLKSIGDGAFRNAGITEVSIPGGVQTIGPQAFARSTLKKVTFETTAANIPIIADNAFQYVYNGDAVYDQSASAVDAYVKETLSKQGWSANGQKGGADSGGGTPPEKPKTTNWVRLAGENAYGTMVKIVDYGFGDGSCSTVVLATFDGYWDALTASGLAGFYTCPVLLTNPDTLSDETRSEMSRLGVTKAYIAGGTAAISSNVEAQVNDMGISTERVAGDDASFTAIQAYEKGKAAGTWSSTAVVATADGYWDALAASPLAYAAHMPIFLANVSDAGAMALNGATVDAIRAGGFTQVIICGGPAAVSPNVESQLDGMNILRLQGATAVETSKAIADYCLGAGMQADGIGVATTDGYWDALTGAALCGKYNAPLVLARPSEPSLAYQGTIENNKDDIGTAFVFGGPAAVPDEVLTALQDSTRTHSNSLMAASIG